MKSPTGKGEAPYEGCIPGRGGQSQRRHGSAYWMYGQKGQRGPPAQKSRVIGSPQGNRAL